MCSKIQNEKRTKCEIYTRVMGYHRPVSSFNIGKKAEFYSRNYFKEENNKNENFDSKGNFIENNLNKKFCENYA